MILCCANSRQKKINHFNFIVELVQALLTENRSESVRKFQGQHSRDKNVPRLLERHFPERIPPTEKRPGQQKVCSVLQKQLKEGNSVL